MAHVRPRVRLRNTSHDTPATTFLEPVEEPDTPFTRHKGIFYTLRVVRELVPSLTLCSSVFFLFMSFFRAIYMDSYVPEVMLPGKHIMLDKALWMRSITVAFEVDYGDPKYKPFWNYNFSGGASVQVYSQDWVPKDDWRDSSRNDWWCVSFGRDSPFYAHTGSDGKCQLPRVPLECSFYPLYGAASIPGSSVYTDSPMRFPDDDDEWGCILPPQTTELARTDWPKQPDRDGQCYSLCLDVIGSRPHLINLMPLDLWHLFLAPAYMELGTLLIWIHSESILSALEGRATSNGQQCAYICAFLFFGILTVALALLTPELQGLICQHWWPGTPVSCALAGMLSFFFFCMATTAKCGPLRCAIKPVVMCLRFSLSVKSNSNELAAKYPIDSDRALCFYLVGFYHSSFNQLRRSLLWLIVLLVTAVTVFVFGPIDPKFDPFVFLRQQATTLVLMGISIFSSLRAPSFKVDYRAHQKKKRLYVLLDKEKDSLFAEFKSLAATANARVEAEGLRFLQHEELCSVDVAANRNQDVVAMGDPSAVCASING